MYIFYISLLFSFSACYLKGYYYMADGVWDSDDIFTFASKEECRAGCKTDARCLAWSFDLVSKMCRYLFQAIVGFSPWPSYVAGLKNCI
jgi:hypothetical protein